MPTLQLTQPNKAHRHITLSRGLSTTMVKIRTTSHGEGSFCYVDKTHALKIIEYLQKELQLPSLGCVDI